MLELLAYLRANGFKTFIVSGGGIEFMRPWRKRFMASRRAGHRQQHQDEVRDARRQAGAGASAELNFNDDKEGKPVGINQHIGRRPVLRSAIRTATCKCSSGQPAGAGGGSASMSTTRRDREWAYDRRGLAPRTAPHRLDEARPTRLDTRGHEEGLETGLRFR